MGDRCTITIHRTASGYLFRIVGRGTLDESPTVKDFICGAIDDGIEVVLDLCECEYLDSTFLGCLVIMQQRSEPGRSSFAVFADESARQKLLKTCSLDRVLSFVEECPEGVGDSVTLQVTRRTRKEFCQHLIDTHRRLADLGGPSAETFRCIVEQLSAELDASYQ